MGSFHSVQLSVFLDFLDGDTAMQQPFAVVDSPVKREKNCEC